tara:strand:- start:1209 stop:1523 length:315 start_codon:yes stop_codon:yes gene_type:complete
MLELLSKKNAVILFAVASQLAGILLYAQNMIGTINHNSEILETLVTDVQALQGKVQNQSFTIDRLSYQNQFQNEALKETVSDLEQEIFLLERDLETIESQIMSR